jgi:DNA recombination protein RmuC
MVDVQMIVIGALGVVLGGILVWWTLRSVPKSESTDIEGQFSVLSAQALDANNKRFLTLAEQALSTKQAEANTDLEVRKTEIEGLMKPLADQIKRLEKENKSMEEARNQAYGDLKQHVKQMIERAENLGREANNLTTALTKSSNERGNWGEVSLANIFEMSGLREGIDYFEQETQEDGKRPDFIVNIPGGGKIPVDAKATGKKFLESISEENDETKNQLLREHAKAMKERVAELKKKEYRDSVEGDVEAVVMFVPSESLLAITFDFEKDLHEYAMKNNILIASPVSILALLRTIAFQWRQFDQTEKTMEILGVCRELYKRFATWSEHYNKVGKGLNAAAADYNKSVNSFNNRLKPQVRELNKLRINEDMGKQITLDQGVENVNSLPSSGQLEE